MTIHRTRRLFATIWQRGDARYATRYTDLAGVRSYGPTFATRRQDSINWFNPSIAHQ